MISKYKVNVRGIIMDEDRIFGQTLKKKAGRVSDFWCTPGGQLELGESLIAGLRREMVEETGVAPQIGKLLFVQQFRDGADEALEFFFHITNADDYKTIDLSKTSHGPIEIEDFGFIDRSSSNLLPAFLQTIDIDSYIRNDQPVYIYTEINNQK